MTQEKQDLDCEKDSDHEAPPMSPFRDCKILRRHNEERKDNRQIASVRREGVYDRWNEPYGQGVAEINFVEMIKRK